MPRKKDPLRLRIELLDKELAEMREKAVEQGGFSGVGSLHGTIGGKNNTYVDAIRQTFLSPSQFIAEWKEGALGQATAKDDAELEKYGIRYQNSAAHGILRLLQKPLVCSYIERFLERNFYKQYDARVRAKPAEALWEIWFGSNNQEYGLLITPRFKEGEWENDVSHIRRVAFDYWTIGHVLETGLVIPHEDGRKNFSDIDQLFEFYKYTVVRAQGSVHAKEFAKQYEQYVQSHDAPCSLPFLIPEFRYQGAEVRHKYRLDFTILSAVNQRRVGIELSPWSTHGRVAGKKKIVSAGGSVEAKQIERWEKDTEKRNDYFSEFGITTVTFTDSKLADNGQAFKKIEKYLKPSLDKRRSILEVDRDIKRYRFD